MSATCPADPETRLPGEELGVVGAGDRALEREFAGCLPACWPGALLVARASVGSTQDICRHLARGGAPEGLVVVADRQTAGRGRRGRQWSAPPGSAVLVSCLLRPPLAPADWPGLTLVAGCVVAEAVEAAAGVRPTLKWPNDVLLRGRKLAGVLAEGSPGDAPHLVLGIGINVTATPETGTPGQTGRAVCLTELGCRATRAELLAALLARLADRYEEFLRAGIEPIRQAWEARAVWGQRVAAAGVEGVAIGLSPAGALVVRRAGGALVQVVAGEVEVLDPAGVS